METRWTYFEAEQVRSQLLVIAKEMGANFSIDDQGWVGFDDAEWALIGDPQIATLDRVFGPDWVAVYADDSQQRLDRVAYLAANDIRFVVWADSVNGIFIVIDRRDCPADWEYA